MRVNYLVPAQIKKPRTRRGFLICARRESNPHFQLRRLTLYPLNYERDKAVVSFILQNYAWAWLNSQKPTLPKFRAGPFCGMGCAACHFAVRALGLLQYSRKPVSIWRQGRWKKPKNQALAASGRARNLRGSPNPIASSAPAPNKYG